MIEILPNKIMNRGGMLLYYRQLIKDGISGAWYLNTVTFCCTRMVLAFEKKELTLTCLSDEMDKHRIRTTGYIIDCPHCHLPIRAVAEELNGNIFKVLL
jgi:hypothetical protein